MSDEKMTDKGLLRQAAVLAALAVGLILLGVGLSHVFGAVGWLVLIVPGVLAAMLALFAFGNAFGYAE